HPKALEEFLNILVDRRQHVLFRRGERPPPFLIGYCRDPSPQLPSLDQPLPRFRFPLCAAASLGVSHQTHDITDGRPMDRSRLKNPALRRHFGGSLFWVPESLAEQGLSTSVTGRLNLSRTLTPSGRRDIGAREATLPTQRLFSGARATIS